MDQARALAAAQAVARAHGLPGDDAVALSGGSNVLVHLRPAPVVARVMTSTAILHPDPALWLAREVAVGTFLAGRGLAVPPSDLIPPGPHEHDGLWMTCWQFVAHAPSADLPPAHEVGAALRALHDALRAFPGPLGPVAEIRDWLDGLLPAGDALRSQLHALTPTVFESALPVQALHGDASARNLLRTPTGLLWNDLEDVCVGPVHWDIAGVISGQSAPYVADLLAAYGGVTREELDDFLAAHELYATIWRAFSLRRRAA